MSTAVMFKIDCYHLALLLAAVSGLTTME